MTVGLSHRPRPSFFSSPAVSSVVMRALLATALAISAFPTWAAPWPTYRRDATRSGVTPESLPTSLTPAWTWLARHAPEPAWPPPARQDFWNRVPELVPEMTFDRAAQVVVAHGAVYFGSSADDQVRSLDAETGEFRWRFFTEGPVRLAPAVFDGRVFFGSDDGYVYCVNAEDGSLLWRSSAAPAHDRVVGNSRMISKWPVRTGVLVEENRVWVVAGILPSFGVHLSCFDAGTGDLLWRTASHRVAAQGYPIASREHLFVPNSRVNVIVFARDNGGFLGEIAGRGGNWALLSEDQLVTGPGLRSTQVRLSQTDTLESLASFDGLGMVLGPKGAAYLYTHTDIAAFDRVQYLEARRQELDLLKEDKRLEAKLRELSVQTDSALREAIQQQRAEFESRRADLQRLMIAAYSWRHGTSTPFAAILADDVLVLGLENQVVGRSVSDGRELWSFPVRGRAYGLASSNGRLYVSTSQGAIHCFAATGDGKVFEEAVLEATASRTVSELSREAAARIASAPNDPEVTARSWNPRGLCLVLDCGDGELVEELVNQTQFRLIGVDADADNVRRARQRLADAGLYGVRAVIHQGDSAALPYPDYFANVVCSAGALVGGKLPHPAEAFRVLRPEGGILELGVACDEVGSLATAAQETLVAWRMPPIREEAGVLLQRDNRRAWLRLFRKPLPGRGEWTHHYASPANTAASNDTRIGDTFRIQWFGKPGPRRMVDRHNRAMAPLVKDGRIFLAADSEIIAVDAYNGTVLWDRPTREFNRLAVYRDAGPMAIADDCLYVAVGAHCYGLKPSTGSELRRFGVPPVLEERESHWGYLAVDGDAVFGSGQAPEAAWRTPGLEVIREAAYYDHRPMVVSDFVFSLDRATGTERWRYRDGVVANSMIAMGNNSVFFVESHDPEALDDRTGRLQLRTLLSPGKVVLTRLDATTGEVIWKHPVDLDFEHVGYLSYSQGMLVATGSRNAEERLWYDLHAFDAETGDHRWSNTFVGFERIGECHGEQDQHPVIMNGRIYARPKELDLQTGELGPLELARGGHGCGHLSGAARHLFGRGGNPRIYDVSTSDGASKALTGSTRPGCLINIIPAGGLVVMPESASGCTCDYPLSMSIVLAPVPAENQQDPATPTGAELEAAQREAAARLRRRGQEMLDLELEWIPSLPPRKPVP